MNKIINMNEITELFHVASSMPAMDDMFNGTIVSWYRANKTRDGFKYDEIIKGYDDMTPEDKRLCEDSLNELFTPFEFKLLSKFMDEELDRQLFIVFKIDLSQPLIRLKKYWPFGYRGEDDTIYLNMMEGYNLPFEVRGWFMPSEGIPVIKHWDAFNFMKL